MLRPRSVTSIALIGGLFLTACTNDATMPTEVTSTTNAPSTSATTIAATTTEAPTTTSATERVDPLLHRFESEPFRGTYLFGNGPDQVEVTLSRDPTSDPPVEAVLVPAANAKLITMGEQTIFCETVTNVCFEVDGTGSGLAAEMLGPLAGGLLVAGQVDVTSGTTVSEPVEVAGRTGICFTYSPPPEAGFESDSVRRCIDSELGLTLLLETERGSAMETLMVLTELGEPRQEDFRPTGPVEPAP